MDTVTKVPPSVQVAEAHLREVCNEEGAIMYSLPLNSSNCIFCSQGGRLDDNTYMSKRKHNRQDSGLIVKYFTFHLRNNYKWHGNNLYI